MDAPKYDAEPPYCRGSNKRRHWLDGWNYYVSGRGHATPPAEFTEGWNAASALHCAGSTVPTRGDY
mgnify:CR=1 FL=1